MPDYNPYPFQSDPDAMLQDFVDELRTYWPNYVPADSQLAYRAAATIIGIIAERIDVAALIPDDIYRTLGKLHNLPPIDATAASADTTWVMRDNAGYPTIPAGTLVSLNGTFFETTDDINVPSGATTATPVGIVAVDEGAAASGLGLPGDVLDLEEPFEYVASITLVGTTANGQDAEDNPTYQTRLRELFTLMSPKALTAANLAVMAQTVIGVDRALALKGYNPTTDTWDNAGTASLALRDALGGIVPTPVKDAVSALLLGPTDRLINADLYIIDATYTPVDVTANAVCYPNADPPTVAAAAEGSVADLFNPATWGQPEQGEQKIWYQKTVVSEYDVGAAIDNTEGLDRVVDIVIGLNGGAQTAGDKNLPGVAPLPQPGAIVVNVVAP